MKSPLIFRIFRDHQLVGVKQFDSDQIVIGQGADVTLKLESPEVSSIHCMIDLRGEDFYLSDLGSKSGTFKNGQAVLDEKISTADEIEIGPFKIQFYIGVPKPKSTPSLEISNQSPAANLHKEHDMPPPAVVKTEALVIPEARPPVPPPVVVKPVGPPVLAKPEIKSDRKSYRRKKRTKTFAPPSELGDLKSYLTPGKGTTVEVVVAWKERILNVFHFKGTQAVRVNSGKGPHIQLPLGVLPKGFLLLETGAVAKVNTMPLMAIQKVTAEGVQDVKPLAHTNGPSIPVEQGEMLCLTLPGENIVLYVRYVKQAPLIPIVPAFISGSEISGIIMSVVLVGLLGLYISASTPKDWQESKQEEVQRMAQVIFDKPPVPKAPPVPVQVPEVAPPPVQPPEPKKIVVSDKRKEEQTKGPEMDKSTKGQTAGRANQVAPKDTKDRTKKFTSLKQGGAVKTGQTEGANAKSANKDLTKVGLFSAFGGNGSRANIDKSYAGAGEVIGMADKATGTAGSAEDRKGDDIGSKFKDSGAGGKGTATQGIAGIETKGRASGQSAYGAAEGFGSKSTVAIQGGGFEEAFDGTIDKEAIRRVIRAKLHEVKGCYERALNVLEKGRKLEGKIVLGWEIIAKGQARNVKVQSSTLKNSQVENCIKDRLASWTFPEPPPGLVAEVQAYPFVLNQAN